jgi:toxin-antitoxin system PIN domain toxin
MRLPDVNVLVYAFREAAPDHDRYRSWLLDVMEAVEPFGLADLVLSGFVRVATHPRIFDPPASLEEALAFADALRAAPNAVPVVPGARHWELFTRMCREGAVRGNLVSHAYLAALAVESGGELITTDRDFARFPGLRWRHPLG